MNKKRQGEWIRDTYQVLHSFPFVKGVLYYAEIPSHGSREAGGSLPVTQFIHASEWNSVEGVSSWDKVLRRDSAAFSPLEALFVEEGICYQVFGPLEGTLLAHNLYGSELLPLGEAAHILKSIADHLLRLHQNNEFALVHPQNILVTPDSVRFLYGGPVGTIPGPGDDPRELNSPYETDETRAVYLLGALAYTLFTGAAPTPGEAPSIRRYREDVPMGWERLILNSLREDAAWRPRLAEIRDGLERVLPPAGNPAPPSPKKAQGVPDDLFTQALLRSVAEPQPRQQKMEGSPGGGEARVNGGDGATGTEQKATTKKKPLHQSPAADQTERPAKGKGFLYTAISGAVIGVAAGIYLLFGVLMADDAEDAARYYGESVRLLREKQVDEAISRAEQAVEADPKEKEYLLHLADLYGEKKADKKATQVLAEGVKSIPDPEVYDSLAMYALSVGDLKQAESAIQKALSLDKKNPVYYYHEGKIHSAKEKDQEAVRSFRKAIQLNPKEGSYYYLLADSLLKLKETKDAVHQAKKATHLKPDHGMVWYKLGQAHLMDRERISKESDLSKKQRESGMANSIEGAIYAFNRSIKLKPDHAASHYYLSISQYYTGDFKASLKSAQESVRLNPKIAPYHFQYGVVLQRLGKGKEAAGSYRKAQELDPGDMRYKEALEQIE